MSNKIRVFVVNPPEEVNGVTLWRMYRPLRLLRDAHGDDLEFVFNIGRITDADLYMADVVLCFRPCNPDHPAVLARAKEFGARVIVDFDDDLLNIPVGYSFYKELSSKAPYVLQCLALSDTVWLSTEHLKGIYLTALQNFLAALRYKNSGHFPPLLGFPSMVVIPNAVLPEDLPAHPNGNTKRVIWRGADFHRDDLEAYKIQYEQLLRQSDYFQWIGYMPTWGEVKNSHARIDFNEGVMAHKWFDFLKALKISMIWKPLVNNVFNRGKSNISRLEATVAGAVCMTNFAGSHPMWEHSTKEIPRLPESYDVLWQKSAEDIKQHYDLRAWNEIRFREILKLVNNG